MKQYTWKNEQRKKITIFLLSLIVIIFIVAAIFGEYTKRSFRNDIKNNHFFKDKKIILSTYSQELGCNNDGYAYDGDISSVEDLINISDCVVKIKLIDADKRQNCTTSLLSKVKVIEVYKGKLLKNQNIMLLEFIEPTKNQIMSVNGYNALKEGKEYIVFLKKFKNRNYSIEHNSGEKMDTDSIYAPVSPILGKYPTNNSYKKVKTLEKKRLNQESKPYKYNTVKNYEIFTDSSKVLNKYIYIGNQVYKRYGGK